MTGSGLLAGFKVRLGKTFTSALPLASHQSHACGFMKLHPRFVSAKRQLFAEK